MSLNFYQLLIPFFALLMLARAYSRWKHNDLSTREFFTWIVIWGGAIAFSLFPDFFLIRISFLTGIKNGVYAIIFFLLIVLLYAALTLFIRFEHLERDITEIVRRDALDKYHKGKQ